MRLPLPVGAQQQVSVERHDYRPSSRAIFLNAGPGEPRNTATWQLGGFLLGSSRLSTSQRGYGAVHQARRRQLAPLVAAGLMTYARCGEPIAAGAPWDLDHAPDRSSYWALPTGPVTGDRRPIVRGRRAGDGEPKPRGAPSPISSTVRAQVSGWPRRRSPCRARRRRLRRTPVRRELGQALHRGRKRGDPGHASP